MKFDATRRYVWATVVLGVFVVLGLVIAAQPAQSGMTADLDGVPKITSGYGSGSGFSEIRATRLVTFTVTVSATDRNAAEAGEDPGTFTFRRIRTADDDLSQPLTVHFTLGGTASPGSGPDDGDYDLSPPACASDCEITIAAGDSEAQLTVEPNDDNEEEPDETVNVTLKPSPDYNRGLPRSATVTIADDDRPEPTPAPARVVRISPKYTGLPWIMTWHDTRVATTSGIVSATAAQGGRLYAGADTSGQRIVFFALHGDGGRIHRGANTSGEIMFTVDFDTGRIWGGHNSSGPLLYTLDPIRLGPRFEVRVHRGRSNGPVIYTIIDDNMYEGANSSGELVYHGSATFRGPIQYLLPLLAEGHIP